MFPQVRVATLVTSAVDLENTASDVRILFAHWDDFFNFEFVIMINLPHLMSPSNITLVLLSKKGTSCLQTKTTFHKTQDQRYSYPQGVASEVSDIPSDRALVPPSMVGRYLGQNRPLMPKFVANGPKYSSSSNSDPMVWGVKVDDQTHPADPVKVV